MTEPVEVARYTYRYQAEMAAGVLDGEGIDAFVLADDAGGMYAGIAAARLVVAPENVDRARRILADLDASGEMDDDEEG